VLLDKNVEPARQGSSKGKRTSGQTPGKNMAAAPWRQFLKRWRRRLFVRRWLLASAAFIISVFIIVSDLTVIEAVCGFIGFCIFAAILPREGLMRRLGTRRGDLPSPSRSANLAGVMIDGLPDPAILLDSDSNVLRFNNKAKEAFPSLRTGYVLSSALRFPEVLSAIEQAGARRVHQSVNVRDGVPVERRFIGNVTWIGGSLSQRSDPAIVILLRDLTEQERISQMRADFVANASHELRTPLSSLLGFIETLRGPARNDASVRDKFLEIMEREAQRMKTLINDLLSLSRAEMNAHLRPSDKVELVEVLRYVASRHEASAGARAIMLELPEAEAEFHVLGEREALVQLFGNLLQNAIKYGREGGYVKIGIAAGGAEGSPEIRVSVSDDGIGIAKEHLPRLTERFYRVTSGPGSEVPGTGLGLSIVKHILNRHRGEMNIVSELGKGSTFTVTLPAYASTMH
jgi:two-component system phosphate regulon sensor histidine kinase PhoR